MTNDEKSSIRDGLQQLAKRAAQNVEARVRAGTLDIDTADPKTELLREMARLADQEFESE